MTTAQFSLSDLVSAVSFMERTAKREGRVPVALGMHPAQWSRLTNETLNELKLASVPREMRPTQKGTLGMFHGLIVLPMAAPGVALFTL